jgi:hypothetical protein
MIDELQAVVPRGSEPIDIDQLMQADADFSKYAVFRNAMLRAARGPDATQKFRKFLEAGMDAKAVKATPTREASDVCDFLANYCEIYVEANRRAKIAADLAPGFVIADASLKEINVYMHLRSASFLVTLLQPPDRRYTSKNEYRDFGKTFKCQLLRMFRARKAKLDAKVRCRQVGISIVTFHKYMCPPYQLCFVPA